MKITIIAVLLYVTFLLAVFKKDMSELSLEISLVPPKLTVNFKKKSEMPISAKSINT